MKIATVVLPGRSDQSRPDLSQVFDADGLALAGSMSRRVLVGRLGGLTGLAVVPMLVVLVLATPHSARDVLTAVGAGALALGAGLVFTAVPRLVPVWGMDLLAAVGAGALVAVAHFSATLRPALPGIYVLIAAAPIAVRPSRAATLHTAMFGASFAGALAVGPPTFAPVTRWFAVMGAVVTCGMFLRWLIDAVIRRAAAEHEAWREASAASADLAATSRAKSEFLARMSHELRTPLNVILGFADLLGEQLVGPLSRQQRDYVADIADSARHLVSLVDDVLDPVKVEQGEVDLDVEAVEVRAVLLDAVRMVRERATVGGVDLQLDLTTDLDRIYGDGRKIRQAVVNLLANAVKFTPRGGEVVLTAYRSAGRLVVSVVDTGVGIAPGDLERIFEEFQQTGGTVEGTGLGLPLARRFAELHGGRLWARSTLGKGSRFVIELPYRPPVSRPAAAADVAAQPDDYEEFTQLGSTSNLQLLARVGSWLATVAAAMCLVFAGITPVVLQVRLVLVLLAVIALGTAFGVRRWGPLVPKVGIELFGPAGIAAVTVLIAFSGPFTDLVPLAYVWVTMVTFTLWRTHRAVMHLVAILVCYTSLLVVLPDRHALTQDLVVTNVLIANSAIVYWLSSRLRRLVAAEQATRRQAEEIRAKLAQASSHKSAFLANMSHELRTPLNAVIGFTDLLESGATGPLEARQLDYLRDIQVSAYHLLTLINDILDLAKIEAGQMLLSNEIVAVPALLERVAAQAQRQAQPRGIVVDVHVGDDALFVRGDPQRLEQVLLNLVSNAVKFTPDGGRVDLDARGVDDDLMVSVRDTGIGILPEQRQKIFEAFSQGEQLSNAVPEGTGLGLPLVKGLVELHGGRVAVESVPERGSNFIVTLPGRASVDVPDMRGVR